MHKRIFISIFFNILRALVNFSTALLIARILNPEGYGNYMFLIGSFVAIRSLVDLGSSSAFYTFISREVRGLDFYLYYFIWLAVQFVTSLSILIFLIPNNIFEQLWLGHNKYIVILAFLATFFQQQVWPMSIQIGESFRKTYFIQKIYIFSSLTYLTIIYLTSFFYELDLEKILWLTIAQFSIFSIVTNVKLIRLIPSKKNLISPKSFLHEFYSYCSPMILISFVNFFYDFSDKWMLQKFSGSFEQGIFQISNQFSMISLLICSSVLNIFWKEIAESWHKGDKNNSYLIYRKALMSLVIISALISGALIPWSNEIIHLLLGEPYKSAWLILSIMLIYPVFQSMGQIAGMMFLATSETRAYFRITCLITLISFCVSYLMLVPINNSYLNTGHGFGSLGLAVKFILIGFLGSNLQTWIISRKNRWSFDFKYQIFGLIIFLTIGFLVKFVFNILNMHSYNNFYLLLIFGAYLLFYLIFSLFIVSKLPGLFGFEISDINRFNLLLMKLKKTIKI